MKQKRFIFILAFIIFLSVMFANNANAIPTFARKYRTSCTTCHIGFNKLNGFGEAYRLNGYNIPAGDAAYIKEEPASLGAPAWARVWPDAVWPGLIPGAVPISFLLHHRVNIQEDNDTTTVDFNMPHEFELIAGGTFGDFASFFGEYVLDEDGGVEGIEQMFIIFNDIFAGNFGDFLPENALNIKIGKFDIAAEPFYEATRRTTQHLQINSYTVGADTWRFRNRQSGFEANGILANRFKYAVGIVNGNGSVNDDNDDKDVYYRLSYKHGGMAFDGTGGEELGEELVQRNNWVDDSITVGTFGYFGASDIAARKNRFFRVGSDLRISYANLDLYGAGVYGRDRTPVAGLTDEVDSFVWFIGGDYVVFPWLITSLRYEDENIWDSGTPDIEKFVTSLLIFPRANIRLTSEFSYFPEWDDGNDGNDLLQFDLTYLF